MENLHTIPGKLFRTKVTILYKNIATGGARIAIFSQTAVSEVVWGPLGSLIYFQWFYEVKIIFIIIP